MSLLVCGTVALDDIKTPSGVQKDMLGGSATHFCMSARLFTKVHLAAIIGKDFPKRYIQFLKQKGIDLDSLIVSEGETFRWEGEYREHDFNTALTLATRLGVLESYLPEVAVHHQNIPYIFLANIDPDVQLQLLSKMNKPKLIGLDSMNLWIEIKKKSLTALMKQVDLFVVNDGEARALTGELNLIKAAKALRKSGPRLIVVKKGEHGVLFYSDECKFSFPAYPVERVVDPTGAGDTFAGGLMGYLSKAKTLNKSSLKQALIYATTIASFNVEGFGMSKTSPLTMPVVNKRMKELMNFISI
jgi:sugar/nucleoside kinase (ribokinase family)